MISTIRAWVEAILGEYEPVTYQVKVMVADALGGSSTTTYTEVAQGVAGVDWSYVVTAALLLVVVYSVFRLLGVLLQAFTGGGRY